MVAIRRFAAAAMLALTAPAYAQGVQVSGLSDVGFGTIGNFGSDLRMDYTIIGQEVNRAARLEQAADPGGILISNETYALVRDDKYLFGWETERQLEGGAVEMTLRVHTLPAVAQIFERDLITAR